MKIRFVLKSICCVLCAAVLALCAASVSAETPESTDAAPDISAYAAVLYEPLSGTVLYEKNSREVLPMASTTKIMTALLALESEHADEPVTITPEMVQVEGSSMGLRAGDVLTLNSIARGMMMASGNDGANAIALYLSGSKESFAEEMNRRAAELNMTQTCFVTPSGLDAEGHGSTAYDMALLAAEAMRCEAFAETVGQTALSVPFISPEKTVCYENHNRLLQLYPDCTGIKTGFTKKAGRCLVSSAKRDGAELICVTLNAPDDWNDHMCLFDYGFAQLQEYACALPAAPLCVSVVGGKSGTVTVNQKETYSVFLPEGTAVTAEYIFPRFCYAPVYKDEEIGRVRYCANGRLLRETPLFAEETVNMQEDSRSELQKQFARFLRSTRGGGIIEFH